MITHREENVEILYEIRNSVEKFQNTVNNAWGVDVMTLEILHDVKELIIYLRSFREMDLDCVKITECVIELDCIIELEWGSELEWPAHL